MLWKIALVAGLGLMSTASAAKVQNGEVIYLVHMYTDANHTEEVGYLTGVCAWHPAIGYYVQYTQHGTYTYFTYDEPVGYCGDDPM